MAFHVGQHILCIDDQPYVANPRMDGLLKGSVYTVRAVGIDPYWNTPGVWLNEINRAVGKGYEHFGEISYATQRFRPLSEARISVFTDMLVNVPKEVV